MEPNLRLCFFFLFSFSFSGMYSSGSLATAEMETVARAVVTTLDANKSVVVLWERLRVR
jgi:hypothetical protein